MTISGMSRVDDAHERAIASILLCTTRQTADQARRRHAKAVVSDFAFPILRARF
jgi:hypothetical protein